jgi:DNA-binding transcriptional regulator LsrR (DeoR family)
MSQAEIAKDLRLSTAKANRLIKQGRELGLIEFKIHSPFQRLINLERRIKKRWQIKECQVVETRSSNDTTTLDLVGRAAAILLNELVGEGCTIAISGGKALSAVAENLNSENKIECTVLPLTGGVQTQNYTDVNYLAGQIAEILGGTAIPLYAPLHADTTQERDMLMSLRRVDEMMRIVSKADVALLGIGAVLGDDATYYKAHPLSDEQRARLYEEGVRAEFLGHLIDGSGELHRTEHNSRLVSLPLDRVREIPTRIGVASGENKIEPLCAVLNGGHINTLIVDEKAARGILKVTSASG